MDIDNIADIETLRTLAKQNRIKLIKDSNADDGTGYIFKEGYWYIVEQIEDSSLLHVMKMEHMLRTMVKSYIF